MKPNSTSNLLSVTAARVASLVLSAAVLFGVSHAAAGFPSVWTVRNETGEALPVRCIGVSNAQLGAFTFQTPTVAPGDRWLHSWPDDNDGLGLEGASYTCAVGDAAGVYTGTRTRFDVGWGENVALRIVARGGDYVVERVPPRVP